MRRTVAIAVLVVGVALAAAQACAPRDCNFVACENNFLRTCQQDGQGQWQIVTRDCGKKAVCSVDDADCVPGKPPSSSSSGGGAGGH